VLARVRGGRTSERGGVGVGEPRCSNLHSDSYSDSESVLRPHRLKPRVQVPHRSLSTIIWGRAGVSKWYLPLLSNREG
jgi:hypothetical protein